MKHAISDKTSTEHLKYWMHRWAFNHQREWYKAGIDNRTRNITKTRQAGADIFFALEGLIDALETGRDQIYFNVGDDTDSAAQQYTLNWMKIGHVADFDIVGGEVSKLNAIRLDNGAQISFVNEGSHAAGYSGNVYVSEYAWAENPGRLLKIAKGISMYERHRSTFYTTPSLNVDAFTFWLQAQKSESQWSQIVTVEDIAGDGCLYCPDDVARLRVKMSELEFTMLYMCQWPTQAVNQVVPL
ncbi:terminase family protein [Yersinia kristensenii]|uniref:terminase large subunit domain-containing protein n=1 Tax=Yersinia kristensenii TaxID=28152 RepID=UPI00285340EE|nr:terminase family protein [Yersinia kristensenii]MDR4896737.1 terminase family protein [Yersinia kristensenii]MDX6735160.1 terminase family protein [Yersinia kristensenii]